MKGKAIITILSSLSFRQDSLQKEFSRLLDTIKERRRADTFAENSSLLRWTKAIWRTSSRITSRSSRNVRLQMPTAVEARLNPCRSFTKHSNSLVWIHMNLWSMISGQTSEVLNQNISEMSFKCEYFHTVEVMCMMIMYDLIHRLGSHCPSITEEKKRMADSPLRRG